MKFMTKISAILIFSITGLFSLGIMSCEKDAEDEVIPKTLEEYKEELSEIVSSQILIVQNCKVGYDKGDYRDELTFEENTTNYLNLLLEAEEVLNMADVTIADIIQANVSVSAAGKAFNDNLFISDRRPIHELIVYCDTLRVHTEVGTEPGQVAEEPRIVFGEAISKAKTVRSASTTIERQVTAAVEELNGELEVFEDAIIK